MAGGRPVAQGRGRCLFWRRPGGLVACPLLAGWPVGVVAWGLLAWGPGGPVACPSVGRLAWWPGGLLAFLAWWPGGLVAWLFPAYTSQHFVLFCPGRGRCLFWHRPRGHRPGGLLARPSVGRMACWPAGLGAGWSVGLVVWWPGGLSLCWPDGLMAWWPGGCWLGGLVVWWPAPLLAGWPDGLLAYWPGGLAFSCVHFTSLCSVLSARVSIDSWRWIVQPICTYNKLLWEFLALFVVVPPGASQLGG